MINLDFDDFTNRIDETARRKLPDGVMGGNIAGREAKIRQKSLLMLFEVFLIRNMAILDAPMQMGKCITCGKGWRLSSATKKRE